MDVTPPSSVRGAFDRLGGHDHGVDVPIDDAGSAAVGPVEAIEPAEVRRRFETDALRAEPRPFGADVVLIEPGSVRSEIGSTGAASPDAVGGAHRHSTEAIRRCAVGQVEGGADPREPAELLVDVVESRRPRTRYLALELRAAGVRR